MEYDNGGVEDFGFPCPPWDDYAAAFDDHNSTINLHPDTFFDGLDDDDDDHHDVGSTIDVICSKERKVESKSCIIKHGRGKELKTAIRVLKPTAYQLGGAYRLHDKKKNKDSNILDDQLKKVMMNKKDTTNTSSSILDDRPKKVPVAAKVMKTTAASSIHKDGSPNMMKIAMQKEAAIKKSSTATTNVDKDEYKPKAVVLENKKEMVAAKNLNMVLERKKEMVVARNLNNNISIGPKGNQDQKEVVVLPIRDEESSMQLKFESAKRKLHHSYERINNSKKQKSIQVIEFQKPPPLPLPKAKARTYYHAKYPHNKFHQPAAILQH